jgi:uncharacterized protein (TIGR02246 family)
MKGDPALKRQIDELNRAAMAAFQRKDAATIAAGFTEDAKLLMPHAPMAVGRQAIAAGWAQMLALPNVSATWQATFVERAQSGELAYEIGTYALEYDGSAGRVRDQGKYVVVWRKEAGVWKIAADIINTDNPPV